MNDKQLEQELDVLKTNLRSEANKYTEAISNKDREQISSLEIKINNLLAEIKSKSALHRNRIAA